MNMKAQKFLNQYKKADVDMSVQGATPHQLVMMLYEGALKNLAMAKGAMERKEYEQKGILLNKTMDILSALTAGLDKDYAPDLVGNLEALYDYIKRRLFTANMKNDPSLIDESMRLLRELKEAWEQVPNQFKTATQEQLNHAKQQVKS
jgi:flagellar protein FliS